MAVSYRLRIIDGPLKGDEVALKPGVDLMIGRARHGVDLGDPRASTRHAEVTWQGGQPWVRDLESATGTLLDGAALGPNPEPLASGQRLLIGDTVLLYERNSQLVPQWVYWAALVVLAVSSPFFFLQLISAPELPTQILLATPEPVRLPGDGSSGPVTVSSVPVDECFMRETLPLGGAHYIRQVTDLDGDEVSEIWLRGPTGERVYTFSATGDWELMGEIPTGCTSTQGGGSVSLNCDIRRYQLEPGVPFVPAPGRCAKGHGDRLALASVQGVFVWLAGPQGDGASAAPRPYTMGVRGLDNLGGWLSERQVDEPVHFVVCEDMLPGMGAYALTQSGRVVSLDPGCASSLEVQGTTGGSEAQVERPSAVAFTETGRRLLVEQISVFLGGSELHHFQAAQDRAIVDIVSGPAPHRSEDVLAVGPAPVGGPAHAVAAEDHALTLEPGDGRLWGRAVPGQLGATTWIWTSPGASLRTPCGVEVQVEAHDRFCPVPCLPNSAFMTIRVPQHGGTFFVPYADQHDKVFTTPDGEVEVSVDVFTPRGLRTQVAAASVAVRDTQVCR